MTWFNRILWPAVILALFAVEAAFLSADRLDGALIVLALQLGLAVFVWHDWQKKA